MTSQKTPLFNKLIAAQGRMVPFAGWEMPIKFSSVIEEHHAVRKKAGLFDISHMGILQIQGEKAKDALQGLVPSDLYRIGPGEACYTVLLNEKAGIIDDLIIYDFGFTDNNEENLLLVINASCTQKDMKWLKENLEPQNISIRDAKGENCFLAIQGPEAMKILEIFSSERLSRIPQFGHRKIKLNNLKSNEDEMIFISRTGYTGEDGFELILPTPTAIELWDLLIKEGVRPCGLGSRDTLRLEAAMHLYGNDLDETTTPLEAGLGWLVHLEMPAQFKGRGVLEKQVIEGPSRRLVGIKIETRAIARQGYKVLSNGEYVGTITSGSWSPTLGQAIALAYVPIQLSKIGTPLEIEIRGKKHPATTTKKPFYRKKQIN